MYVAQSVRLIDEFEATLIKLGVENIIKIHSETTSNVVTDVMNVLRDPPDMAVVLISHSAFFRIPYFPDRSDWQIFFDERSRDRHVSPS